MYINTVWYLSTKSCTYFIYHIFASFIIINKKLGLIYQEVGRNKIVNKYEFSGILLNDD